MRARRPLPFRAFMAPARPLPTQEEIALQRIVKTRLRATWSLPSGDWASGCTRSIHPAADPVRPLSPNTKQRRRLRPYLDQRRAYSFCSSMPTFGSRTRVR